MVHTTSGGENPYNDITAWYATNEEIDQFDEDPNWQPNFDYYATDLAEGLLAEVTQTQNDGTLAHARVYSDGFEVNGIVRGLATAHEKSTYDLLNILIDNEGAALLGAYIIYDTDFSKNRALGTRKVNLHQASVFLAHYSGKSGLYQTDIVRRPGTRLRWHAINAQLDETGTPLILKDSESREQ
jgi:hypothetical protein